MCHLLITKRWLAWTHTNLILARIFLLTVSRLTSHNGPVVSIKWYLYIFALWRVSESVTGRRHAGFGWWLLNVDGDATRANWLDSDTKVNNYRLPLRVVDCTFQSLSFGCTGFDKSWSVYSQNDNWLRQIELTIVKDIKNCTSRSPGRGQNMHLVTLVGATYTPAVILVSHNREKAAWRMQFIFRLNTVFTFAKTCVPTKARVPSLLCYLIPRWIHAFMVLVEVIFASLLVPVSFIQNPFSHGIFLSWLNFTNILKSGTRLLKQKNNSKNTVKSE